MEATLTSFDELLALERKAAEPTPGEVRELRRHVWQRLGLGTAAGVLGMTGTAWATVAAVTTLIAAATTSVYWTTTRAVAHGNARAWASAPGAPREVVAKQVPVAEAAPVREAAAEPPPAPEAALPASEVAAPAARRPVISANRTLSVTPSSPPEVAVRTEAAPTDQFDADLARLREVSRALSSGRAAEALMLTRAHDVAKSPLAAEYQAAEAIALCQLGRRAEALRAVELFERVARDSPLARRVRRACGGQ